MAATSELHTVSHIFYATDFQWRELCCQVGVKVTADIDGSGEIEVTSMELHSFAFATDKSGDCFPDWLDMLIVEGERGDELIEKVLESIGWLEIDATLANS